MSEPRSKGIDFEQFLGTTLLRNAVTYGKKQTVYTQEEPAGALFYVMRGNVSLTLVSPQGREAVLAFVGGGDFFGEECLAEPALRVAGATTITACSFVRIGSVEVKRMFREVPLFLESFTAYLVARSIRMAQDLSDQLLYPSEQRLARTLFLLANHATSGDPRKAMPAITHATLASKVGTTRARVSHFMSKFKKLGLIEYRDGLRVHPSLLTAVSQDGAWVAGPRSIATLMPVHRRASDLSLLPRRTKPSGSRTASHG